jgi:hypothetical protein
VLILKGVKVLCFDTLSQVFILKKLARNGFLAGVKLAEVRMTVTTPGGAEATIGKTIGGHGSLQEERFGILWESRRDEAYYCTKIVYQSGDYRVNKIPN